MHARVVVMWSGRRQHMPWVWVCQRCDFDSCSPFAYKSRDEVIWLVGEMCDAVFIGWHDISENAKAHTRCLQPPPAGWGT